MCPASTRHYVYFHVKTPSRKSIFSGGGYEEYKFRFKKVGFDHSTDGHAIFDEYYLVDYIFGPFNKGGDEVMSEAHLLSHFNHVSLAVPIVPLHADTSMRNIELGTLRRKRRGNSHSYKGRGAGDGDSQSRVFTAKTLDV